MPALLRLRVRLLAPRTRAHASNAASANAGRSRAFDSHSRPDSFESGDVLCFNGDVDAGCCHGLLEITDKTVAGAEERLPEWCKGKRVSLQWRGRKDEGVSEFDEKIEAQKRAQGAGSSS